MTKVFLKNHNQYIKILVLLTISLIAGCSNNNTSTLPPVSNSNSNQKGLEIKFLVGSDLQEFCNRSAKKLNSSQPKLDNGQPYYLTCEAKGSGDVVTQILDLVKQYQQGTIKAEAPEFPTLLSVDGEIYQSQLMFQMNKLAPGKNYIPEITDSPLIVYSPMVFMTTKDLAPGLEKVKDPYTALAKFDNHQQLDPNAPALPINYVHTAPTRSNSGLQTLVAQFASVAGKRPEDLTIADIKNNQDQVRKIQEKITRYGKSTGTLARSMVQNGIFWASVGSVYESLVIEANSKLPPDQTPYQAIYPPATFSSNIRAILPQAPWVNEQEQEAANKIIEFMRLPENQKVAVDLGLRPGVPGVALGAKFSPQFGVQTNPNYDSYRPPKPEVVEAMLTSWTEFAKKPSQVVVVIDTSGSMRGKKMTSVQNTLFRYINNLHLKEKIALIAFDSEIDQPVIIESTPEGKNKGIKLVSQLQPDGGTRLYDSVLVARNWLRKNLRPDAINAVLVLTDGNDSNSNITLDELNKQLAESGFNSDERIAFFTIGYGESGQFNAQALQQIAEINGGYYRQGNPETIANLMADLQDEF
jgi:Ca-activated chloride channel family protein